MSSKELLSTHTFPTNKKHAKQCGAPALRVNASENKANHMAGNSMNVPTVGAFVLAAVLGLRCTDNR